VIDVMVVNRRVQAARRRRHRHRTVLNATGPYASGRRMLA
jgi:hypothetical protein